MIVSSHNQGDNAPSGLVAGRPLSSNLVAKEKHRGRGLLRHPLPLVPGASARFFTGAQKTNRRFAIRTWVQPQAFAVASIFGSMPRCLNQQRRERA